MELQKQTIIIGRNRDGYYYADRNVNKHETVMLDAFGALVSKFAMLIQHDEDNKSNIEYRIDIKRILRD